ncbi:MAG TPA: alpha/beta fold hydrolase [Kofleriaceae bacterium]|nr:alpha/beta fold hydrolase [Kofleriaceae bacterium]
MNLRTLFLAVPAIAAAGCFSGMAPPGGDDDDGAWSIDDAIEYRDLDAHPGCTTEGLSYTAADIDGYRCAAKRYAFPSGTSEDTSAPIVILVHGNSDAPDSWESFEGGAPMLAERLTARGLRVYALDLRIDEVDDPQNNNDTENAARNVDHGWAVPLAQHLIESVLEAEPDRQVSLVGFSLGVTTIRDALRRIHAAGDVTLWPRLDDVVLLAGANHGVSSFARLCGRNPTMRGRVACEMGSRDSFSPTDFSLALNGPDHAYETPCADGETAYGDAACNGHRVTYTTIVMRDIANGSYQDEFVSEASTALEGADNRLLALTDTDESGYFFGGLLKNHYGACRSAAALDIIDEVLP